MTVISRTNLCTNPSFETSTAGWAAGGANPPVLERTTALHSIGHHGLASTPDNAALDIVGDIDLRAEISYISSFWGTGSILSKGFLGATQQSYELLLGFTGTVPHLTLRWSTTGADTLFVDHAIPEFLPGQRLAVRATLDVDDGAGNRVVSFYTAPTMSHTFVLHG